MNPLFSMPHLVVAGAVLVVLGLFLAWRSTAQCRGRVRYAILTARGLGLAGLGLLALNPGRWEVRRETQGYEFAVLLDRSQSMATPDVAGRARWDAGRELAETALAAGRDGAAAVRVFTFAEQLETPEALTTLRPDGPQTRLAASGAALVARYRTGSKGLAGVFLLSDGRATGAPAEADLGLLARAAECPLYPVVLGGAVPVRDLSLAPLRREYVAFRDQPLSVGVRVQNAALGRISPALELVDAAGQVLARQTLALDSGEELTATFALKPTAPGFYEYTVRTAPWPGESTALNNQAPVGVLVLGSKLKVFLAEGTPSWDSKFMAQLLRQQPNLELCSVYRLAANRFFRVEADTRQVSGAETASFPDTPGALAAYDLVVFGKGAEYFLDPLRLGLLRDFVRDHGGSVLFFRGKPYTGEFAELAWLEPVRWDARAEGRFRLAPTPGGEEAGLFGRLLPAAADPRWRQLPTLRCSYCCREVKGFAQVLAQGLPAAGVGPAVPLVVSRRFGKGLVITVNAEDLWQWDFFPTDPASSELYHELWPQLIQWAATYSEYLPGHEFSLQLSDSAVFPQAPIHARISRRPGANEEVVPALRRRGTDGDVLARAAGAAPNPDGGWDLAFALPAPGVYEVELVDARNGQALGPCLGVQVKDLPAESTNVSADPEALARLAAASGGRVLAPAEVAAVIRGFQGPAPAADVGQATWVPAWDTPLVLLLLVGALGGEWFLRRRNGLL